MSAPVLAFRNPKAKRRRDPLVAEAARLLNELPPRLAETYVRTIRATAEALGRKRAARAARPRNIGKPVIDIESDTTKEGA